MRFRTRVMQPLPERAYPLVPLSHSGDHLGPEYVGRSSTTWHLPGVPCGAVGEPATEYEFRHLFYCGDCANVEDRHDEMVETLNLIEVGLRDAERNRLDNP